MHEQFLIPLTVDDLKKSYACALGTVFVVDDEPNLLFFLSKILRQEGFWVVEFNSGLNLIEYIESEIKRYPGPRCVLSDVNMPELSGLDLQNKLKQYKDITFVMMTGLGHVHYAVEAFRQGAVHFLTKPIDADNMIDTIRESLSQSNQFSQEWQNFNKLSEMVKSLTEREHQVIALVARGMLNKQIANLLNIGIRTVKIHRHNAYNKLEVKHAAQLSIYSNLIGLEDIDL